MDKLSKKELKILVIILFITTFIFVFISLIIFIKNKNCVYNYELYGKFYKSNFCYTKNNDYYCYKDNKIIKVDSYYFEV